MSGRTPAWIALGVAQTLAFASSYYLPAMLAASMAAEFGLLPSTVFGLFSLALIVSALVGPLAGRRIDRHGGRRVLMISSGLFVLALAALAGASGPWSLAAGWLLMGLAMGCGLYEAAFASLVRLYGHSARSAITGVTLIAGFASTVGWPLSALFEQQLGWRGACAAWAGLHLLLGLPLYAMLPRPLPGTEPAACGRAGPALPRDTASGVQMPGVTTVAPPRHTAVLLSLVFAAIWFVSTAMAAHLPALMLAAGGGLSLAVLAGILVGPAQVAGRLFEFGLLRGVSPLLVARVATLSHPLAALLLGLGGAAMALPFAVLHGLGNGILTIAKGTLPLALFGPAGYGARQGWIDLPGRVLQSLSPWIFGIVLEQDLGAALALSAGLALLSFVALCAIRLPSASRPRR